MAPSRPPAPRSKWTAGVWRASPAPDGPDERPHEPGPEPDWEESWWFDFVAAGPDGNLVGGFVRLGLWPNHNRAWYWAALVGDGRRYLLVRDEDVPLPRPGRTEVRADGLWSALECETPFDHWTIGLEAFAVALDDPAEAWGDERGDRVGLGFDLEWEAVANPVMAPDAGRGYRQECRVSGEVLAGRDERFTIDGHGARAHRWGPAALPQSAPSAGPAQGGPRRATYRAPLRCGTDRVAFELVDVTLQGESIRGFWQASPVALSNS